MIFKANGVAVFLDRDGTINEECGYLNHVDRLRLIEGAADAVRLFNEYGLKTIIVSNQSGVARGYFPESMLKALHEKLRGLLEAQGARLDAVYYCPHHPNAGEPPYRQACDCRKPNLGMIRRAEQEFAVLPRISYMVGDKLSDVEFGRKAGCKAILVLTGYGKGEWEYNRDKCSVEPDYVARDVLDAAHWIIEDLNSGRSKV
ncbi:MAG: D-glycero-beta-D-manno-heptose 1,7-bisphosphate 7-phosphatase [Candidatus Abyssubacteria bacterium]